jgi:hypothetical protein
VRRAAEQQTFALTHVSLGSEQFEIREITADSNGRKKVRREQLATGQANSQDEEGAGIGINQT